MNNQLKELLNDVNDYSGMNELASYILKNIQLNVCNESYTFLEIECYIYKDDHQDIFTHCHSGQKKFLQWYFHQLSEKEHSYKGGTRKGLDFCLGSKKCFAGILIRGLLRKSDGFIIEGPCKCVNEILLQSETESIKDLVCNKLDENLSCLTNDILYLSISKNKCNIYIAPRVGLTLKGDIDAKKEYITKHYRYIADKNKIKKEKMKMIAL